MDANISAGMHLTTPRIGHAHHGVYIGDGKVIHYRGLYRYLLLRGSVEEVEIARFARGRRVVPTSRGGARYGAAEIVSRARSRLGEARYHLFNNNCEHFVEWCVRGESRSLQIEALKNRLHCLARLLRGSRVALDGPSAHGGY
jgi:hypothetical protein